MKEKNDKSIRFLYGTVFGRGLLKLIQKPFLISLKTTLYL